MKRLPLNRLPVYALLLSLWGLLACTLTPPARAQHDTTSAFGVLFNSAAGGANAFDGTKTLAQLGIDDSSPGGPHASVSGGALVITQGASENTSTPVLKTTSSTPFGTETIEFTGASLTYGYSSLTLMGAYQPNGGGTGISRSYGITIQQGRVYLSETYNEGVVNLGQPLFSIGNGVNYTYSATDTYRLSLTLSAGLGQSTDLSGILYDVTTGDMEFVRHEGDRTIPLGGGAWGIADSFCKPATITKWVIASNFGDGTNTYPALNAKIVARNGDSITYGTNSATGGAASPLGTNEPSVLARQLGPTWTVYNLGKPGLTAGNLEVQNGAEIAGLPATATDSTYDLAIGTNDVAQNAAAGTGTPDPNYSAANILARAKVLLGYARAAGFTHNIIHTVPYSVQAAGNGNTQAQNTALFKAGADALNALIRTQLVGSANGSWADAICDDNAIPQLRDPTNLTYFATDGRHLTDAGYALVAAADYNALASVDPSGVAQPFVLSTSDEALLAGAQKAGQAVTLPALPPVTLVANQSVAPVTLAPSQAFNNTGQTSAPAWLGVSSVLLPAELSTLNAAATPASTVTAMIAAMKTDSVLSRTFSRAFGKYTYNVPTHVMSLLKDDGTPLLAADGVTPVTLTLTNDVTGAITAKQ